MTRPAESWRASTADGAQALTRASGSSSSKNVGQCKALTLHHSVTGLHAPRAREHAANAEGSVWSAC